MRIGGSQLIDPVARLAGLANWVALHALTSAWTPLGAGAGNPHGDALICPFRHLVKFTAAAFLDQQMCQLVRQHRLQVDGWRHVGIQKHPVFGLSGSCPWNVNVAQEAA